MTANNQPESRLSDQERNKGRTAFLVLVAIFFLPLIAAWLMYFGVIDWKPSGLKANGELIQPPVPIDIGEPRFLIDPQEANLLRDKWTLVFVDDQCDQDCEASLVLMRQVRMSLGRYLDRISRALVVRDEVDDVERLTGAFPGMDIVQSDELASRILEAAGQPAGARIYVVDPLGNLTIMFAHDSEPRPMYNDLKHLLKISRIG